MSICNRNCCENKINSSYIKWLIEVLGPVILGSKPAEILNLSSKEMNKESKLNDIKSFFSNCSKLSYKIINIPDGGIRLVFINKDALSITKVYPLSRTILKKVFLRNKMISVLNRSHLA